LNSEVIGRESRARGYAARRKRKLDEYRAQLGGDETSRNVRARREPPIPGDDFDRSGSDSDDSDDESEIGLEAGMDNAATAAATADEDADEADLFRETVGYSVIESCVNGLTELWNDQRRSKTDPNPHEVLRGKELTALLAAVRQADWDRRRVENVDRALCTIADGYDQPKMKEAISWCWQEGSTARNGPEPYLRTAADFLLGQSVSSSSSCTTPRIGNNPIWRWDPFIYLALRLGIKRDPSTRPFIY
jgi:hypothetical protein